MNTDEVAQLVVRNTKSELASRLIQFAMPVIIAIVSFLGSQWLDTIQAKQEAQAQAVGVTRNLVDGALTRLAVVENNQTMGRDERLRSDAAMNAKLDKILEMQLQLAQDVAGLKAMRPGR